MVAIPNPLDVARRTAFSPVAKAFELDRFPQEQYTDPPGDPGLFGPASVTWKIHADASMLVGGVSALMLQALHPLAMAGVAEHSDYRERPLQRLSRTSSFVMATTYAATEVAESIIDIVRAVHTRVVGTSPDGRPYAAGDPALLRWVHVTEVASFLRAHRRYHPFPVRGDDLDRYVDEMAVVAERLGATDVPRSRAGMAAYFGSVRPELAVGEQAREAMGFLVRGMTSDPLTRTAQPILIRAAIGLLPGWARSLYGIGHPLPFELGVVRPATWALLSGMRLAGGTPPAVAEARARCASPLSRPLAA